MKCLVCSKEASENGYCERHRRAYKSIVKKYDGWKRALEISWEEYLSRIKKNPSTGEWAKEVADYLIESEDESDVTQS